MPTSPGPTSPTPDDPVAPGTPRPASARTVRRWRRHLAAERAEAAIYRDLARRRQGEEREILLALADAEARHEAHWLGLLGEDAGRPARVDLRTRALGWLARRFGSVFVLALAQRAEARSPYDDDVHATAQMAADEVVHEEVVRGLAARGRSRISGTFRAAVFGANDGLVSNFALVLGVGATGVASGTILVTGLAGLLAGALSMGAGEYISVRSQRELLAATRPDPRAQRAVRHLDVDANELALVYRARGMSPEVAAEQAREVIAGTGRHLGPVAPGADALEAGAAEAGAAGAGAAEADAPEPDAHEAVGTAWRAAGSSFVFFATGAVVPVLPYLFGLTGMTAVAVAAVLVGLALVATGSVVGLLSGGNLVTRAVRQVAIGYGAAAATYALGLVFGATVG